MAEVASSEVAAASSHARLGPFLVQRDGMLSPADASKAPGFTVQWRHRTVRVSMLSEPTGQGEAGVLAFTVVAGRIPSSAEGTASRQQALAVAQELRACCGAPWRLALLPDHRIALALREPLALPVSAVELITRVATFVLAVDPLVDLLAEYGAGFQERDPGE